MNVPYNGKVIKLGSRGRAVAGAKRALKKAGYGDRVQPSQFFGIYADRNLRHFQTSQGLRPDGQVGPATLKALEPFFDEYGYLLYTGHNPPGTDTIQILKVFVPTHDTGGLPNFPAIDLFADPGTQVLAPEDCTLVWPHMIEWDKTRRVGGMTCYLQGARNTYFLTHFGMLNVSGGYAEGDVLGTVAAVPHGWWESHIHEGLHKGRFNPLQT